MLVRLFSTVLICSVVLVFPVTQIPLYHPLDHTGLPLFLVEGAFAQYKQEFSTGDIHELRWEIMTIEDNMVKVEIRSHGLLFNTTTESFDIVPGGGAFVIDKDTWKIQEAYYSNGTEIDGYPVGETTAFWISSETNESMSINTMYERNAYPTLTDPLVFDCLSSARTCWMTRNVYSTGNQMNRYYDQETGIVLMIETQRTISSVDISVLETLNGTNISPLVASPINGVLGSFVVVLLVALPVSFLTVLLLYLGRRKIWRTSSLSSLEINWLSKKRSGVRVTPAPPFSPLL